MPAVMRLVGFTDGGFSSHREVVHRFINKNATWGVLQEILEDAAFECQAHPDPYVMRQDATEQIERLDAFFSADEAWRYAVQTKQTELSLEDWTRCAYRAPMAVFEIVEEEHFLQTPSYYSENE